MTDEVTASADISPKDSDFLLDQGKARELDGVQPSTDEGTPPAPQQVQEQGTEQPIEQGAEPQPWWAEAGFNSEADAVNSIKHAQQKITQQGQLLSDYQKREQYYQTLVDQWMPQEQPEEPEAPEWNDEQINELFDTNPAEALRLIKEQAKTEAKRELLADPNLQTAIAVGRTSVADRIVNNLREATNNDSTQYEADVGKFLNELFQEDPQSAEACARSPKLLHKLYLAAKQERIASGQVQQTQNDTRTSQLVNKYANLGGVQMNPGTPSPGGVEPVDKSKQLVDTKVAGVGQVPAADLEFVTDVDQRITLNR